MAGRFGKFLLGSLASFFAALAIIMLIFVHVGQTRPFSLPIRSSLITIDTTNIGAGTGSYAQGLYSYCNYMVCSPVSFLGGQFRPYDQVAADVPANLMVAYANSFAGTTFANTPYLQRLGQAAFWTIFFGSLFAIFAFILGFIPFTFSHALAALFAGLSFIGLLVGAAIWTSIFQSIRYTGRGLQVYYGAANGVLWGAAIAMLIAFLFYIIAAMTHKHRRQEKHVETYVAQPAPVVMAPVTPVVATPVYNNHQRAFAEESIIDGRNSTSAYGSQHGLVDRNEMQQSTVYPHDSSVTAPVTLAPTARI